MVRIGLFCLAAFARPSRSPAPWQSGLDLPRMSGANGTTAVEGVSLTGPSPRARGCPTVWFVTAGLDSVRPRRRGFSVTASIAGPRFGPLAA